MSKNDWPQKGDQYWYVNWESVLRPSTEVRYWVLSERNKGERE